MCSKQDFQPQNVGVEPSDVGGEKDNFIIVLQLLQEKPHTTAKELAIKLHTTTRTAERLLRQLKHREKYGVKAAIVLDIGLWRRQIRRNKR